MPLEVQITIPRGAYGAAVEGLAGVNCALLAMLDGRIVDGRTVPRLYESGVRYREPGKLRWHTIADLYDKGYGDCKDLAAARCAELRYFDGEPAMPYVYRSRDRGDGRLRWHAVVRRADGTIEDPSAILIAQERGR